jgi:hypothetical protein
MPAITRSSTSSSLSRLDDAVEEECRLTRTRQVPPSLVLSRSTQAGPKWHRDMVLPIPCSVQIALQAPNVQEGHPAVSFEGQWAPSQQGLDCVAIFDGTGWRLELLSGVATNIRSGNLLKIR